MKLIRIKPLSEATLEDTCRMAVAIFDDEVEAPDIEIRASLEQKDYTEGFTGHRVMRNDYWTALDHQNRVTGFIGLYEQEIDSQEAAWIGWFGVHPDCRGEGIGKALLDFVFREAEKRGRKFLRVYSSTYFAEKEALEMYRRRGFIVTSAEPYAPDPSLTILYLEKKIRNRSF